MTDQPANRMKNHDAVARRHRSRLAAVQALYQVDLVAVDAEQAVTELLARRDQAPNFDEAYLSRLAGGAEAGLTELDVLISERLSADWPMARLSVTARALLRVATFELRECMDVPARVVVSEYVDIARGFFDEAETGFINGVLDGLARGLRSREMGVNDPEAAENPSDNAEQGGDDDGTAG